MNTSVSARRSPGPWLALFLIALWTAGCATNKINWEARVGNYTYDQAVRDFGPPDKQARLQDGTIVAEWMTHRGYAYTYPPFGYYRYPYWYAAPYPGYVDAPDYFLRLTFGPDGKLTAWKKFAR